MILNPYYLLKPHNKKPKIHKIKLESSCPSVCQIYNLCCPLLLCCMSQLSGECEAGRTMGPGNHLLYLSQKILENLTCRTLISFIAQS